MDTGVMHVVTRRRFLEVASASVGAALLAACTSGPGPTATSAVTTTPPPGSPTAASANSPAASTAPTARAAGGVGSATAPAVTGSAASGTRAATSGSAVSATGTTGSAAANTATTGSATVRTAASSVSSPAAAASGTAGSQAVGQTLTIKAVDYGFQTMGSIPGGLVTIQLQNLGKEPHQAQLARLNDGVTPDQFLAALKNDFQNQGNTADMLATLEGGPNGVVPGSSNEVIQDLKVGQYILLCFIPNAMGVPHAALGMTLPLMVTAPALPATMIPMVNGTITLANDDFDLPMLPVGRSLFRIVNNGAQPADFQLLGIAPGKTLDDVKQFVASPPPDSMMASAAPPAMAGPPPVTGGAGIASLSPGGSGIAVFNLTAGEYAAWTGDPSTGIAQITVG